MPPGRERGFALLIVLWTVVFLTLIVTGMTGTGRADVRLANNLRGAAVAQSTADGLIYETAFHLLDHATPLLADGQPHPVAVADGQAIVVIDNEAGKINLNSAAPALLQALLHQVGVEPRQAAILAGAIADWRFPASSPGQKDAPYRAAGLPYAPPGAPFESLGELGHVIGMTPDILEKLEPNISILNDSEPDLHVAPPLVAAAIAEATGVRRPPPGNPAPLRTVTITARVTTGSQSRFIRRAAIRLAANPKEPLLTVLTWESLFDPP